MEAFIYLFIISCNLTVHFVKFFKSFTIEGIQNIISILSLFISWDGWLYKGPGRVRFQGEVEVLFGFSYFMYVTCCRLSNFSAHFAGNERFLPAFSSSFWLCFEQADLAQPRKRLGCEVNFLSTVSGTFD